jgi:hypothetical protein
MVTGVSEERAASTFRVKSQAYIKDMYAERDYI